MDKSNQMLYQPLAIDPTPLTNLTMYNRIYEAVSIAVSLDLFTYLQTDKRPGQLAGELNLDEDAVYPLLKALAQVGCVAENDGKFSATPLAGAYLVSSSNLYIGQEFEPGSFGRQFLQVLSDRQAETAQGLRWSKERLRQIGTFGLMGLIQSTVAGCQLTNARRLLDLGGGHGFYSIAFAQKYPLLQVTLFDLPHMVKLAEDFVRQFSLEQRITLCGGNFMEDSIGGGYDAVLCSNVFFDQKRDFVLDKAYQALNPGGQLIVNTRIRDAANNLANCATALLLQVRGAKELLSFLEWQSALECHNFRQVKMAGLSGMFATIIAQKGDPGDEGNR